MSFISLKYKKNIYNIFCLAFWRPIIECVAICWVLLNPEIKCYTFYNVSKKCQTFLKHIFSSIHTVGTATQFGFQNQPIQNNHTYIFIRCFSRQSRSNVQCRLCQQRGYYSLLFSLLQTFYVLYIHFFLSKVPLCWILWHAGNFETVFYPTYLNICLMWKYVDYPHCWHFNFLIT